MSYQQFKEILLQALLALPRFLKNPIQGMRDLPDWEWPILLALQALLGLVCGLLAAFLSGSLILIITSIVIAPLSNVAVNLILSGFFYYTFLFFFKNEVSYKLIVTHLLFASIPVLLCNVISPVIPFIGVIGVVGAYDTAIQLARHRNGLGIGLENACCERNGHARGSKGSWLAGPAPRRYKTGLLVGV